MHQHGGSGKVPASHGFQGKSQRFGEAILGIRTALPRSLCIFYATLTTSFRYFFELVPAKTCVAQVHTDLPVLVQYNAELVLLEQNSMSACHTEIVSDVQEIAAAEHICSHVMIEQERATRDLQFRAETGVGRVKAQLDPGVRGC